LVDIRLPYLSCVLELNYFFFFQEEDGIRDRNVTGVQTCALPIWEKTRSFTATKWLRMMWIRKARLSAEEAHWAGMPSESRITARSEERRVGKEYRCRR